MFNSPMKSKSLLIVLPSVRLGMTLWLSLKICMTMRRMKSQKWICLMPFTVTVRKARMIAKILCLCRAMTLTLTAKKRLVRVNPTTLTTRKSLTLKKKTTKVMPLTKSLMMSLMTLTWSRVKSLASQRLLLIRHSVTMKSS